MHIQVQRVKATNTFCVHVLRSQLSNALTVNACASAIGVGDEGEGWLAITRVGGTVILIPAARELIAGVENVVQRDAATRV